MAPAKRRRSASSIGPIVPPCSRARSIAAGDGIGGVATSGAPGRSFSLGVADAVTILARGAAQADAAATVVANAVDLPGDPRIARAPARSLQPDSDLGDRLVTRNVPPLDRELIARALDSGLAVARSLLGRGLIVAAALHLQGRDARRGRRAIRARVGSARARWANRGASSMPEVEARERIEASEIKGKDGLG